MSDINEISDRQDAINKQADEIIAQQNELDNDKRENKDVVEEKVRGQEEAQSFTGIQQEETYHDLLDNGFDASDVIRIVDAFASGKIRHITVDWLKKQ